MAKRATLHELRRQLELRDELEAAAKLDEDGNVVAVLVPDPDDDIRIYVGYLDGSLVTAVMSRDQTMKFEVAFDAEGYARNAVRYSALTLNQKLDLLRLLRSNDRFYLVWPSEPVTPDVVAYVDEQVRRLEDEDATSDVDALCPLRVLHD